MSNFITYKPLAVKGTLSSLEVYRTYLILSLVWSPYYLTSKTCKNKDKYNSTLQILKRFGNECASAIFDFSTAICGSLFCLHLAKVFNVQGLFMKNCLVKKFVLPLSLFCLLYFLGFSTRNVSNLSTI